LSSAVDPGFRFAQSGQRLERRLSPNQPRELAEAPRQPIALELAIDTGQPQHQSAAFDLQQV
jgi:hypothetical protein